MNEDFLILAYHTKDSGYGYSIIRKSDDLDLGGLDEFKGLAEIVKHVQADITEINLAVKNKVEFGGFPLDRNRRARKTPAFRLVVKGELTKSF